MNFGDDVLGERGGAPATPDLHEYWLPGSPPGAAPYNLYGISKEELSVTIEGSPVALPVRYVTVRGEGYGLCYLRGNPRSMHLSTVQVVDSELEADAFLRGELQPAHEQTSP